MDSRENTDDAYKRACERERELWIQIRNRCPGDPGADEALWSEWLKAAELVRVLATERAFEIRLRR